ncbi:murein transglycosylase A [Roseibium sp.]|uniref:murein transglycosylase A n=1 Tax=Roseibium sp. TaxID=1936156 RepID=UPI003A9780D0
MKGISTAQAAPGLVRTSFDKISGWNTDDHASALTAFVRVCRQAPQVFKKKPLDLSSARVRELCARGEAALGRGNEDARSFFESEFTPHHFSSSGFLTGYFEPELPASRIKTDDFATPLLKAPEGLVAITDRNRPDGWANELSHGRLTDKGLVPLPDRPAIMDGALQKEELEFVYLADPIDAFFVHVQGSARLKLDDGSVMRVGYAGKTGHPYTSIARVLVNRGEGRPEDLTASGLRKWLQDNPDKRDDLFRENRSFIFFREVQLDDPQDGPVGSVGIPLVAGRSLAVDPTHIPYGAPVFVSADISGISDNPISFPRLVIADDTGSAIRGAARGDLFAGSGAEAGRIAGELRHGARMTVLLPRKRTTQGSKG